ncbi:MAG: decarboxylase [Acidobacteria bacterium]|nr:decarboxylase [Acidobacteriota bacterium]
MTDSRVPALARELLDAFTTGARVPVPPSARPGGIDVNTGYAVEAEIVRLRRAAGRRTVGRKIGVANRAVWPAMGITTVVWGNMYDDTVQQAKSGRATQSLARMRAPRIEPEVVVKLKGVPPAGAGAAAVIEAVDWMALGFEIVDCPFPDWKFKGGDFLASLGLHAALVVGTPRTIRRDEVAALVDQFAAFKTRLSRNGQIVEEGGGKNVLESPALCLAEFVAAVPAQPGVEPLGAGELISTGSTTAAKPVAAGEQWTMEVEGLDLAPLTVDLVA